MTPKYQLKLATALGLIRGSLRGKDMEEINKKGLFKSLEEVEKILTEIVGSDDK